MADDRGSPPPPTRGDRRSRLAVGVIFGMHGVAAGSWAVRIPWVAESLRLSPGELGVALFGAAAGGVCAMPLAGRMVARHGSHTSMRIGIAALSVSVALPPFASNLPLLFAALVCFGAGQGILDVAMNVGGVEVQERYGRPIMASLHGLWSAGTMGGAAVGGTVAEVGVDAPVHLAAVGVAVLGIGLPAARLLAGSAARTAEPAFAWPGRGVWLVGVVAFCSFFAEAAAADWSAVYLRTRTAASPGVAAAAYTAFSITMMLGRFFGDRAIARIGAVGLATGLLVPSPSVAIAAFGLLGLGVSTVVPLAFSAAGGRADPDRGTSVAAVATVGYGGWLAAPALIGLVADVTSLTVSLALVAGLTAVIAVGAPVLRR
ncbi:MAG: MFS transporter [Streptosporangiales bacterium]|nr:MFS transporter [Streptosporangiales bacterium]